MAPRFLQTPQHKLPQKPSSSSSKAKPQNTPKFKPKQLDDDAFATPDPVRPGHRFTTTTTPTVPDHGTPAKAPSSSIKRQPPRFNDGFATPSAPATKHRAKPGLFDVDPHFSTTPRFGAERPSSPKRPRLAAQHDDVVENDAVRKIFTTPRRFVVRHLENEGVDEAEDDDGGGGGNGGDGDDTMLSNDFDDNNEDDGFRPNSRNNHAIHNKQNDYLQPSRPSFLNSHHTHNTSSPSPPDQIPEDPTQHLPISPLPHRPIFLAPPPQTTDSASASAPLPQHFSPHRRGAKFLSGGMAEEMARWLINTRNFSSQSHRAINEDTLILRVVEVSGSGEDGMVLLRGDVDGGGGARVCMPGGSVERGSDGVVRQGSVLLLKGVRWDVEIDGQVWLVGTQYGIQP